MPVMSELFVDQLITANRKMRTMFDARARQMGLTLSRARLLVQLAREDGQSQTQLAQTLEVEQPSIVGLVDALEKAGLVERRPDEADRRQRNVHLTPAAREQASDLLAYVARIRADILRGIPTEEIRCASEVLTRVLGNIDRCTK